LLPAQIYLRGKPDKFSSGFRLPNRQEDVKFLQAGAASMSRCVARGNPVGQSLPMRGNRLALATRVQPSSQDIFCTLLYSRFSATNASCRLNLEWRCNRGKPNVSIKTHAGRICAEQVISCNVELPC
jgi:hypothetical protein